MFNRPLSPPDICHEGFSGEFAEILEDPYSPTGWTFESTIGTPVLESEYSNPESEDSHLESEYFTPFMMASNIGATSTMPKISHDSSYHSRAYSTTNPSNLEDRFVYDWDDGEWKFAPTSPRKPKAYFCVFPECEAAFARPYDLGMHQQSRHGWDDGEWKFAPILSPSQVESTNSPKTAKRSTSSSTSFRPQIPSPRSPDREIVYNNHYNFGKQQESRHATEDAASNDMPTSSSSPRKPKPYFCVFPGCEAAFARPYDLGRHQQSRHVNSIRFDCPVETCRRFGVPMATNERGGFTRLDHFRDHVKNLHGKSVIRDKNSDGGQYWVTDPVKRDGGLWMRDETGSILVKDHNGCIQVKDATTGRWHIRDR